MLGMVRLNGGTVIVMPELISEDRYGGARRACELNH